MVTVWKMRPDNPLVAGLPLLEARVSRLQGVILSLIRWGKGAKANDMLALLLTETSDE